MTKRIEIERSLVLIKPDGVERGLTGEIISRFERVGLKIIAMKMLTPSADHVGAHYPAADEWGSVWEFTKKKAAERGDDFKETPLEFGTRLKRGLLEYMQSGPIVAMIVAGPGAVKLIRKIVGATEPFGSAPGTIRGDFCLDTYKASDMEDRPIRNIIHASGEIDEAEKEMKIWFGEGEIHVPRSVLDDVVTNPDHFR